MSTRSLTKSERRRREHRRVILNILDDFGEDRGRQGDNQRDRRASWTTSLLHPYSRPKPSGPNCGLGQSWVSPFKCWVPPPIWGRFWTCRKAEVSAGSRVLIAGAGPVGLLSTQFALALGASEVRVSDINTRRLQLARDLG